MQIMEIYHALTVKIFYHHDSGKTQPKDTKPNFGKAAFTKLLHLSVVVLSMRKRNCRKLYHQKQDWDTLHNMNSKCIFTIHSKGS